MPQPSGRDFAFANKMQNYLSELLGSHSLSEFITTVVVLILIALASWVIIKILHRMVGKISFFKWNQEKRTFRRTKISKECESTIIWGARFFISLIYFWLVPSVFSPYPGIIRLIGTICAFFSLVVCVLMINAALDWLFAILNHSPTAKRVFPLKSITQLLKIIVVTLAMIIGVAILIHKSPAIILSSMGAMTAILMLIFRDSILGLVAGIQLTRNDMVRVGDWIEMPKYNADGVVVDIALTTVKVRNWDNTVTMLPSYILISDSFKNWRYMEESGGRRMNRSVKIDIFSIRFCTEEMIERFSKIKYVSEYIEEKKKQIAEHNKSFGGTNESLANGRHLTNIGVFEAYLMNYLRNNPYVNQNLTMIVRQLDSTENGVPVEVLAFLIKKQWEEYEAIQNDIFDHIFAVLPEFDLRPMQRNSGYADLVAMEKRG